MSTEAFYLTTESDNLDDFAEIIRLATDDGNVHGGDSVELIRLATFSDDNDRGSTLFEVNTGADDWEILDTAAISDPEVRQQRNLNEFYSCSNSGK